MAPIISGQPNPMPVVDQAKIAAVGYVQPSSSTLRAPTNSQIDVQSQTSSGSPQNPAVSSSLSLAEASKISRLQDNDYGNLSPDQAAAVAAQSSPVVNSLGQTNDFSDDSKAHFLPGATWQNDPALKSEAEIVDDEGSPEIPSSGPVLDSSQSSILENLEQSKENVAKFDQLLKDSQEVQHGGSINEDSEDEELGAEGSRALLVFGLASLIAGVYFYIKIKRVKDRERIHYGILDDREFELRHLSMSSDEEVGYSMRGSHEVNTPRNSRKGGRGGGGLGMNTSMVDSSDSEDATVYSNRRKVKSKKQFTEYV